MGEGEGRLRKYGCGDNSCLIERPSGMATNGRCRCFDGINDAATRRRVNIGVSRMRAELDRLEARVRELEGLFAKVEALRDPDFEMVLIEMLDGKIVGIQFAHLHHDMEEDEGDVMAPTLEEAIAAIEDTER